MPTKASQHIAFFAVFIISVLLHRFVYLNLKRILLRDYPKAGPRLQRIALWSFVAMDLPFAFIFFRGAITAELTLLTRLILYPFSIWQAIMLLWAVILVPVTLIRRREQLGVAYIRRIARRWKERSFEDTEETAEDELVLES